MQTKGTEALGRQS